MGKIAAALEKSGRHIESPLPPKPVDAPNAKTAERPAGPVAQAKFETISKGVDPNLITLGGNQSFATEQFKLLKTHLLFEKGDHPPRLIMVTSTLPGEGKSFVSANLAVCFAQNVNEHVLLIDCDLRRPTIHKLFGMDTPPGLSEYLQNGKDLSQFLVKTPQDKLTLLPAGRIPKNPLELIASQKMNELLSEIKHRYNDRYVIIDTPPPHLTAESNALAKQVDAVLLVIKHGFADRSIISDLAEKIGKEKLAGVVFNHFEMPGLSTLGYGKYGKYGKYSHYYK